MSTGNSGIYLHSMIITHISQAKVKTILELGASDALTQ